MSQLPSYVAAAKPVPKANRVPWYASTAQTYAGIMLWFVFWQAIVEGGGTGSPGGVLAAGIMPAILAVVVAALICHFLFYLVPGLLGMRTGLPLYVVGTSTYGVQGGLFMPGFLMGLLQFGWLAVNAWAVGTLLCDCFKLTPEVPSAPHAIIASLFAILAAFVGLKGIQYVARVATFLPLIPLLLLVWLLVATIGGIGNFKPEMLTAAAPAAAPAADAAAQPAANADAAETLPVEETPAAKGAAQAEAAETKVEAAQPLTALGVFLLLTTYIVGFFATAGAAGCDIASSNRDANDVQLGGLTGVAAATILAGGIAILAIAGAYGAGMVSAANMGTLNPIKMLGDIVGEGNKNWIMILLAVSSFPPACFSAFIAANSFKTTMPNVNPFVSVGIGTAVAIVLAVTGVVGQVIWVFVLIGASFGPVCGAMMADYLLAGGKWAGPRAGFNPAGWISWIVGFAVGAFNLVAGWIPAISHLQGIVPAAPVAAFIVGFVLYYVLAMAGMQSKSLEMPAAAE
ncbi:MAG: cytosine permease [Planctomycetota bacterium]